MAVTAAPMFLGVLWKEPRGPVRLVGFIVGGSVFPIIYAKLINPNGSVILIFYFNMELAL